MELALGKSNKEVAQAYNVSASYVSKVKTGKKTPSLKITDYSVLKTDFFEVDNTDLTSILIMINSKDIIINKEEIIEYIESQMKKCIVHAKMYQIILDKIKGENNGR